MPNSIQIQGLDRMRAMLGRDFQPALRAATEAIAEQVRHELTPYPPATIANSPSNPNRRWYERGYGPRWLIVGGGRPRAQDLPDAQPLLGRHPRRRGGP